MQIAKETHRLPIRPQRHQHLRSRGLGRALRLDGVALFVDCLEILAIKDDVGAFFTRQHGVRLRSSGDENGTRGQRHFPVRTLQAQRTGVPELILFHFQRREIFRESNALFQGLGYFLVIQSVAGRIDQAAAIRDGDPAPAVDQINKPGLAIFRLGRRPFRAHRASMFQKLSRGRLLFFGPRLRQRDPILFKLGITIQKFFDLDNVVRQRLRSRVDGRKSATDHDHGQAQLQIGDRIGLGRARQLQRHEEIRRLPHAAHQAVLHRHYRRTPCAHAQRHVVEAHFISAFDGNRAAKPHATEHGKLASAFHQQAFQFQIVLVPANRNAVLRHASKARHHAVVQGFEEIFDVVDGFERNAPAMRIHAGNRRVQRLDLESVNSGDRVAVVHQMM